MDEAEDAISHHDWDVVRDHAQSVLALDPGNLDGTALIEAVERAVGSLDDPTVTPTSLGVPQAERRQLTVMFCDLQGSTALSQKLDPEELRDVIRGYQEVCGAAVARFDGYVAKYLGDGLSATLKPTRTTPSGRSGLVWQFLRTSATLILSSKWTKTWNWAYG